MWQFFRYIASFKTHTNSNFHPFIFCQVALSWSSFPVHFNTGYYQWGTFERNWRNCFFRKNQFRLRVAFNYVHGIYLLQPNQRVGNQLHEYRIKKIRSKEKAKSGEFQLSFCQLVNVNWTWQILFYETCLSRLFFVRSLA